MDKERKILLSFAIYTDQQYYSLMLFLSLQKTIGFPIIVLYKEAEKIFIAMACIPSCILCLYLATVMGIDENGDSIFFHCSLSCG